MGLKGDSGGQRVTGEGGTQTHSGVEYESEESEVSKQRSANVKGVLFVAMAR